MAWGKTATHNGEPAQPFFDPKEAVRAALIAVVTYLAVATAQKPGNLADKVERHEVKLAVLESKMDAQVDLSKQILVEVRRRGR